MDLFKGIDAILIKNASLPFIDENFFYFTGIDGMEESIAVITPDRVEIIAPLLEKRDGITVYRSRKERDEILKKLLRGKKVGINGKALVYEDYKHFKKMFDLVDISKRLEMKRAIKSNEEIKRIRKAVRITKDVMKEIEFEGKSEMEVANEIKCMLARRNAGEAFETIVAFGKNSSMPHHKPGRKKFVMPALIDMGARYESYCADITRTFMKKNKRYEVIEEALYLAIDSIQAGMKASELYRKVEQFLDRHGIKMIHALGHAIGIKVHDGLTISKKANFEFENGMVFAIEPAGYFKKYGIRIEEDILIKNGRARIMA